MLPGKLNKTHFCGNKQSKKSKQTTPLIHLLIGQDQQFLRFSCCDSIHYKRLHQSVLSHAYSKATFPAWESGLEDKSYDANRCLINTKRSKKIRETLLICFCEHAPKDEFIQSGLTGTEDASEVKTNLPLSDHMFHWVRVQSMSNKTVEAGQKCWGWYNEVYGVCQCCRQTGRRPNATLQAYIGSTRLAPQSDDCCVQLAVFTLVGWLEKTAQMSNHSLHSYCKKKTYNILQIVRLKWLLLNASFKRLVNCKNVVRTKQNHRCRYWQICKKINRRESKSPGSYIEPEILNHQKTSTLEKSDTNKNAFPG